MKHDYIRHIILCLCLLAGTNAFAYDAEIDGICYNFSGSEATVAGYSGDTDAVVIPSSVMSGGNTYTVTSIGEKAFYFNSSMTSVTIPESVTSISYRAFYFCSALTSVTIPESVTSIGDEAFYYCYKLTSLVVPGSVKSIGNEAFSGCDLTSLTLEEGIIAIGDEAFKSNYQLSSLTIPNSVTTIGQGVFSGCNGLRSVTLGDNVQFIGSGAFYTYTQLYVRRGTDALLTLWESSLSAYDVETEEFLGKPGFGETYKTQTTLAFYVKNLYPEFENVFNYDFAQVSGNWYQVAGLCPNTEYTLVLDIKSPNKCLTLKRSATTRSVEMEVDRKEVTNLTISAIGYYDAGDAEVTESGFEGIGVGDECTVTGLVPGERHEFVYYVVISDKYTLRKTIWYETIPVEASASYEAGASSCLLTGELHGVIDATVTDFGFDGYPGQTDVKLTGLDPETQYTKAFHVTTLEGGTVQTEVSFTTMPLILTTKQPKVITEGNVIVAAESNLDDEETNVGFEWRRTDWTDDFDSRTGGAYLYEGMMEGYIRSINSNYLWKFRPYYTSNAGNTYYGEWKGMDPSDYSYFEPTVHTYAAINVQGNRAEVKGYAMRGTDNVTSQGFMYWAGGSPSSSRMKAGGVPSSAKTVLASGNVMIATLEDLEYEQAYSYVAFVTTSEGETFYGEVQTFSTSVDPDGINDVKASEEVTEVARYDLNGRKLAAPQRGINIIRYSDGATRKVMIK